MRALARMCATDRVPIARPLLLAVWIVGAWALIALSGWLAVG